MLCKYYSTYRNALYLVGIQHLIFLIEGIVELAERLDSVQFSRSVASDSATPWTAACQASLSFTNSRSLLKLMSIESVMPSNYLILCRPFFSCLHSFPASESFQMSQFFSSGGQSTGVSASASVLPVNIGKIGLTSKCLYNFQPKFLFYVMT